MVEEKEEDVEGEGETIKGANNKKQNEKHWKEKKTK